MNSLALAIAFPPGPRRALRVEADGVARDRCRRALSAAVPGRRRARHHTEQHPRLRTDRLSARAAARRNPCGAVQQDRPHLPAAVRLHDAGLPAAVRDPAERDDRHDDRCRILVFHLPGADRRCGRCALVPAPLSPLPRAVRGPAGRRIADRAEPVRSAGSSFFDMRDGQLRALGSFRNASSLGTLGASLLPLYVALAWDRDDRISAGLGVGIACAIVYYSNSGGPASAAAVGLLAWLAWPLRHNMRRVRVLLALTLASLALAMQAPIWYLPARSVPSPAAAAGTDHACWRWRPNTSANGGWRAWTSTRPKGGSPMYYKRRIPPTSRTISWRSDCAAGRRPCCCCCCCW